MSIGILIFLSLAVGIGAWLLFVWSVKSGQYEDPEGPKYRMLDDEDAPPARPERRPGAGERPPPKVDR
jgi:cbb3-type cytochrome oxidase maturation protein